MSVTLKFINGEFTETKDGNHHATLELTPDGAGGNAKLIFSPDAGLIARRTASRQAESICKSGFLLKSGERIGIGMILEIADADKLSEAHLREGHKYNRY